MHQENIIRKRTATDLLGRFVLLVALVTGCGQEPSDESLQVVTPELAELVSAVTSGNVASRDVIEVRFVEPAVDANQIGSLVNERVFTFTPSIDGTARWETARVLVFRPLRPLPLSQSYRGRLDLAALLPARADLQPLLINFEVAGREILSLEGDFELRNANDPSFLIYRGRLVLTAEADPQMVREAVSLRQRETPLPLTWQADAAGKAFTFTSSVIERNTTRQTYELVVDAEKLDLAQSYSMEIPLVPWQDMVLEAVGREDAGENPRLTLLFSDELDLRQSIEGLLQIRPAIPIRLRPSGKQLFVDGDFSYGQTYELEIHAGIRNKWGTRSKETVRRTVDFGDRKPQLRFAHDGVFLPSSQDKRLRFTTLNLRRVSLEVKKVFASNLGQFLQTQRLDSRRERRNSFGDYYLRRVGVQVAERTLEIPDTRNTWLEHDLDLGSLIAEGERGLFLVSLSFDRDDMFYRPPSDAVDGEDSYYWDSSDPRSRGYIRAHGRVYKALMVSDIGLTYKRGHDEHLVYATDIGDARPLPGVRVNLRTYQNQVVAAGVTNARGVARFEDVDEEIFYVEGERKGQRSLVRPGNMAWNLSSFDVGGVETRPGATRAFIYTERGVYRPGDEINVSVIARHHDGTFPDDHPATCEIYNPRDQLVFELVQRRGREGLYSFSFATDTEDPTGNWRARVRIGDGTFDHVLKIETIVPYRLEIEITPARERLGRNDESVGMDMRANYLFGSPAAGLEAELTVSLQRAPKTSPRYRTFSFTNALIDYQPLEAVIFEGRLDAEGSARGEWSLPTLVNVPSALVAVLEARVLEKGGRPNYQRHRISVDPYDYYVGLQKPDFDYGYARVGTTVRIPAVAIDVQGNPVAERSLRYRVYRGLTYWWWEYENREEFRRRFKRDRRTELVSEEQFVSKSTPVDLLFEPNEPGEYLIEVVDGEEGHTAAFFVRAGLWGRAPAGGESDGVLALKTDRERYGQGETAVVSFPVPDKGSILFSLEQGQQVLSSRWYHLDGTQEEARIPFTVSSAMIPTVYATVSLIQPHGQTDNDRPVRMYGTLPIEVYDPSTRLDLDVRVPDVLRPNTPFTVEVQSVADSVEFTIAVVDEGLLALTEYRTPDPWGFFFQKQRLGVHTSDLFAHVIGVSRGDPFRVFAIGGSEYLDYGDARSGRDRRRLPPVSMFAGPLTTDATGRALVEFTMPNYVGAVRTMVVGTQGRRFGRVEKTTEVKDDLMVMSYLPRTIGPGDRLEVPVTAFAMADSLDDLEISIETRGPLDVIGSVRREIGSAARGEHDTLFELRARQAVGAATVLVEARAGDTNASRQTHVDIRPASPPLYESDERRVVPGETVSFTVPDKGLPGTNRARISVRRRPDFNFDNQMLRLVRYPYGCVEQTVSAVFPQLYLKDLLDLEADRRHTVAADIDRNVNEAISKLRRFRRPDGSFSFWPGGVRTSVWGSIYAGHFLIEALKLGYHVPDDMYQGWLRYQETQSTMTHDHLKTRAYRVYLLAMAGHPARGGMNLLKENELYSMQNLEKWLLATAYLHAGVQGTAYEIARTAGVSVAEYREFANTYGSHLRDKALILDNLVAFRDWDAADPLAEEIARAITGDWHSTQTTSVALLALGKYALALQPGDDSSAPLTGHIRLPGGRTVPFSIDGLGHQLEISGGFGEEVYVHLDADNVAEHAYAALDWEGVPLQDAGGEQEENIRLEVVWLDEDGRSIDPGSLARGTTFWGHIRVESAIEAGIEEVALTQLVPAGWEIENTRLSSEVRPDWMKGWRLNAEEYMDIRDDRIDWFFDLPRHGRPLDFAVKLNAVTQGTFILPPTQVEAMYNRDYRARKAGGTVVVGP